MDWMTAADAADVLLADRNAGSVVRDPDEVWMNRDVFVFRSEIEVVDGTMLAVHRSTGEARLVAAPPQEPEPFPDLVRVGDIPERPVS